MEMYEWRFTNVDLAQMFKKMEKKLRDKEAAYQKRLQAWETREKKRIKDYELDKERSVAKENEIAEEARKLQIFFEDYDDEKWDVKYYRGTELERRLTSRRAEEIADEKDRAKEVEQIESTRQRLLKEQNPNVEMIILRMEQTMQEHLQKRLKIDFDSLPVTAMPTAADESKPMASAFLSDGGGGGSSSVGGLALVGAALSSPSSSQLLANNVTDNGSGALKSENEIASDDSMTQHQSHRSTDAGKKHSDGGGSSSEGTSSKSRTGWDCFGIFVS